MENYCLGFRVEGHILGRTGANRVYRVLMPFSSGSGRVVMVVAAVGYGWYWQYWW